jgi:TrmH family RNA methyltransferase
MDITSLQNPRVKAAVKLREDKRARKQEGLFIVEGWDEITLALASGFQPRTLYTAPELVSRQISGLTADELFTVSQSVFAKMSYRDHPDGWLAIFPIPARTLDAIRFNAAPFIIVAESVEKPGNLGAILRTADAAGADALIVADPRADVYNPNVVRASRGALFTVPTVEASSAQALAWLRQNKIQILAATPNTDRLFTNVDLRQPLAIAVGTEDEGLTDYWMQQADLQVKIPMMGKVNSLNVSTSTAIIAYEVVRQRNLADR